MITEDDVRMLVAMTVETLFGGPPDGWAPPGPTDEDGFRGAVQISGAVEVEVAVWCGARFARHAASTMFGAEAEAMTEAELRDAVGEIANILGGNLKALLPAPCVLSCPLVAPTSAGLTPPGLRFAVEGQPFAVAFGAS